MVSALVPEGGELGGSGAEALAGAQVADEQRVQRVLLQPPPAAPQLLVHELGGHVLRCVQFRVGAQGDQLRLREGAHFGRSMPGNLRLRRS